MKRIFSLGWVPSFPSRALAVWATVALSHVAQAATWGGGAGNDTWSDDANWTGDSGITDGDSAVFADAGLGPSVMDMDSPFTVSELTYQNTSGTHTLDLNGRKLIVNQLYAGYETQTSTAVITNGSLQVGGKVLIGYNDNAGAAQNAVGSVTVSNVTFTSGSLNNWFCVGANLAGAGSAYPDHAIGTLDMSGAHNGVFTYTASFFHIGANYSDFASTAPNSGILRFGDNWDIDIGTPASPVYQFYFGNYGNAEMSAGTGGSFSAYFTYFRFGTRGNATLNMAGITNGLISLPASGLQAFGDGKGAAGYTSALNLGSNWTIRCNGTATPAFGYDGAATTVSASNLTITGTAFRFYVGTASGPGSVGGQCALAVGSLGAGLAISDDLWVGCWQAAANGSLTLPAGDMTVGGMARVGEGGAGALTLNGTRLALTTPSGTGLKVGTGGRVNVNVGAQSCGPEFSRDSSAAMILDSTTTTGRGLMITFTRNPIGPGGLPLERGTAADHDGIFYGLKWSGDRTATAAYELGYYVNSSNVSWDDSALTGPFADAVNLFYDPATNATYIGCYVRRASGALIIVR
jgi:hypothetical protein